MTAKPQPTLSFPSGQAPLAAPWYSRMSIKRLTSRLTPKWLARRRMQRRARTQPLPSITITPPWDDPKPDAWTSNSPSQRPQNPTLDIPSCEVSRANSNISAGSTDSLGLTNEDREGLFYVFAPPRHLPVPPVMVDSMNPLGDAVDGMLRDNAGGVRLGLEFMGFRREVVDRLLSAYSVAFSSVPPSHQTSLSSFNAVKRAVSSTSFGRWVA